MKRHLLALAVPPLAVCRYGCASCCAGPIGLFWVTGIVALVYGFFGGPLGLTTVSWATLGLGVVLWAIAGVWAMVVVKGVDREKCTQKKPSPLCTQLRLDEKDPFDEIKKTG